MIQEILALVVVEAVVSDHAEILLGNMDKDLLQQFAAGFLYSYTFCSFMIIIIPDDLMSFFIEGSDSAFSHGRPSSIANEVVYAALNIFTIFIG